MNNNDNNDNNDTVNISFQDLQLLLNHKKQTHQQGGHDVGKANNAISRVSLQAFNPDESMIIGKGPIGTTVYGVLKHPLYCALTTFLLSVGIFLYIKPAPFFTPNGRFKHYRIGRVYMSLMSTIIVIAIMCIMIAL